MSDAQNWAFAQHWPGCQSQFGGACTCRQLTNGLGWQQQSTTDALLSNILAELKEMRRSLDDARLSIYEIAKRLDHE